METKVELRCSDCGTYFVEKVLDECLELGEANVECPDCGVTDDHDIIGKVD